MRSTRRLTRRWPSLSTSWWFRSFGYLWGKIQMTKDISFVKYVERYSLQLQTCASISSPPWGETINWPQLVLIVAPVSIGKTQDGAHWWSNKKVFSMRLDVVSTFQYEHIVHLGFSLVLSFTFGFWLYLQDCKFDEMFVTISSISALVRPLPA